MGDTHVLVDAGLTGKAVTQALGNIDLTPADLSAILVTHEHSDHIRGVGVLARRFGIPIYANELTWAAMWKSVGEVPLAQRRVFYGEEDFYIGPMSVQPFSIPHDAADPVGYSLYAGDKKISIATDLGHVSARILDRVSASDVLLMEANHDVSMLENNPKYPAYLKRRIRGSQGHLSNDQCADALHKLLSRNVRTVYLGHLSEQTNAPETAYAAVAGFLAAQGVSVGKDIYIGMTWRDKVGDLLTVT